MKKRLRKAKRKLRQGKWSSAIRALCTPHHSEKKILSARAEVCAHLKKIHGNSVAHGAFKGMHLPEASYWGKTDASAKILGTYESQVTAKLAEFARPGGLLLDIGSADGFFAVGALRAGLFTRCVCFERSEKGRSVLRANAEKNGVLERIAIQGEATEAQIIAAAASGQTGVVLCDIEGGEFHALSETVLQHLSNMCIIVELHDFLVENGTQLKAALLDRSSRYFDVEIMTSAAPEMWSYPELDHFSDDERLLAFSEGRDAAMQWLVLRPKGFAK